MLTAPSTCRACGAGFFARASFQTACSPKCARAVVKAKKTEEREQRKADKRRLMELDPRRYPKAKAAAQDAFNGWVRRRDANLPCITCGRTKTPRWDAGHYLSRGARPELSFHPDNCHKQCARCNTFEAGSAGAFRLALIAKIGEARVAALEGPHPPAKWTVADLQAIKSEYTAKAKELEVMA